MDKDKIFEIVKKAKAPDIDADRMRRTGDAAWRKIRTKKSPIRWLHAGAFKPAISFGAIILLLSFFPVAHVVKQSTRSGSGDASSETNLINSAQLTQYPAGVRTAVVRMVIGGVKVEDLRFNTPEEYQNLRLTRNSVFHPSGGGAIFQVAPIDLMAKKIAGEWFYNMEMNIPGIGSKLAEIIAFLPGVDWSVCQKLNQEVGIPGIPKALGNFSMLYTRRMIDRGEGDYTPPEESVDLALEGTSSQPFACFEDTATGQYVYYHVLVER